MYLEIDLTRKETFLNNKKQLHVTVVWAPKMCPFSGFKIKAVFRNPNSKISVIYERPFSKIANAG